MAAMAHDDIIYIHSPDWQGNELSILPVTKLFTLLALAVTQLA